MPISSDVVAELWNLDGANIQRAHNVLCSEGYEFVGYHGCNHKTLKSIVPYNFDTSRIGTGAGTARGPGFYVSRGYNLADDYSDEATQDGDPEPPHYAVPRKSGDAGIRRVLRIYARYFSAMRVGMHYNWGVQSRAGDPNGDLNVTSRAGQNISACVPDLEIVFRITAYSRLAAIPSLGPRLDRLYCGARIGQWRAHEI